MRKRRRPEVLRRNASRWILWFGICIALAFGEQGQEHGIDMYAVWTMAFTRVSDIPSAHALSKYL